MGVFNVHYAGAMKRYLERVAATVPPAPFIGIPTSWYILVYRFSFPKPSNESFYSQNDITAMFEGNLGHCRSWNLEYVVLQERPLKTW